MDSGARKQKSTHWFYGDSTVDLAERNVEEFPLGLLTKKNPKGEKRLVFEDVIDDSSTGERVPRMLVISANVDTDLPNYWDQDVQVGLQILSHRQDPYLFPERVEFTIYSLLKVMQLPNSTKNIRRVVKSLDNWNGVRFKYSHWWNGSSWEHPKAFLLLQDYDLSRKGLGKRDPETPQFFTWSRYFVESIRASRTKPFDSEFYFGLKNPTTRRAFRFLDKRLENCGYYRKDLVEFATQKIGLSPGRKPSQYPERLRVAYEELTKEGFLANVAERKRYKNPDTGKWQFYCKRGPGRKNRSQVAVPLKLVVDNESMGELEAELAKRGVQPGNGPTECGGIVAACTDESLIRQNCERYDWLIENTRDVRGPGLLISQTRKGKLLQLPKGAKTASEKAKAKEAIARRDALKKELDEKKVDIAPLYEGVAIGAFESLGEALQQELWGDAFQAAPLGKKKQLTEQSEGSRVHQETRRKVLLGRFEAVKKRVQCEQEATWAEKEWYRQGRLVFQRLEMTEKWQEYVEVRDAFEKALADLKN